MKPRKEAGHGTLTGNAGEYYVVAELLRRGVVAALAPRNSPVFDVFAAKGARTVRIRVKTKLKSKGWVWTARTDQAILPDLRREGDFTVLVDLFKRETPAYHVVPSHVLEGWLRENHERWLKTLGKGGKPHRDNRMRSLYPDRLEDQFRLKPYAGVCAWERLWSESESQAP